MSKPKIETFELPVAKDLNPLNRFRVPAKQWGTWNANARQVFNHVCGIMRENYDVLKHPKAEKPKGAHLGTLSWNTAWLAADAVMGR